MLVVSDVTLTSLGRELRVLQNHDYCSARLHGPQSPGLAFKFPNEWRTIDSHKTAPAPLGITMFRVLVGPRASVSSILSKQVCSEHPCVRSIFGISVIRTILGDKEAANQI